MIIIYQVALGYLVWCIIGWIVLLWSVKEHGNATTFAEAQEEALDGMSSGEAFLRFLTWGLFWFPVSVHAVVSTAINKILRYRTYKMIKRNLKRLREQAETPEELIEIKDAETLVEQMYAGKVDE